MRHRFTPRRITPGTTTRPADEDIESATARLQSLVDGVVEVLLLLSPDAMSWDMPVGSVDRAFYADARFIRAHRRVHEVLDRLRDDLPGGHLEDLEDLDTAVRRAMSDAAGVGWRLGILMSRNISTEAA